MTFKMNNQWDQNVYAGFYQLPIFIVFLQVGHGHDKKSLVHTGTMRGDNWIEAETATNPTYLYISYILFMFASFMFSLLINLWHEFVTKLWQLSFELERLVQDLLLEHVVVHGHDCQSHQQVAVVHIELHVHLASVRGAGDEVTKANLWGVAIIRIQSLWGVKDTNFLKANYL